MAEHSETWDGGLTVSADSDGTDSYDFGSRAAAVTSLKSGLRLPEMTPLPSPWTLEIEPTLLCNARSIFVPTRISSQIFASGSARYR